MQKSPQSFDFELVLVLVYEFLHCKFLPVGNTIFGSFVSGFQADLPNELCFRETKESSNGFGMLRR